MSLDKFGKRRKIDMRFILIILSTTNVLQISSQSNDIFARLVEDYRQACQQTWTDAEQACCGFCSYDEQCDEDGNCCLDAHQNMRQALGYDDSDYWYGSVICVQPKLSSQNRTKHGVTKDAVLMMKDGCNQFGNFILWQLCKNPGINNHILSEIPIFDDGRHDTIPFRNKFCAECSKSNNEASYTYWHVSIRCDGTITFNYENLLHFVQEENCEIHFKPPLFRYATPCNYSSDFTVSSCNVTGQWKEYDNVIEAACHSTSDPFNRTYRNYFCYLCNTDNPEQNELWSWSCGAPGGQQDKSNTRYSLDLSFDLLSKIENGVVLGCDPNTQFVDLKKMVCRPFYCNDISFDKDKCDWKMRRQAAYCLVMFIKLTFGTRNRFNRELLRTKRIHAYFEKVFSETFRGVKIYLKTVDQSGVSFVDYLVVQINLADNTMDDILAQFVKLIEGRPCYVGLSDLFPICDMVYNDDIAEQNLELVSEFTIPECNDKKHRVINKLYLCLHVILRQDEFQMDIDNNGLIITISSTHIFRFSPGEYEFTNEIIKLCIEDYLRIYKALPPILNKDEPQKNGVTTSTHFNGVTIDYVTLFCIFYNWSFQKSTTVDAFVVT